MNLKEIKDFLESQRIGRYFSGEEKTKFKDLAKLIGANVPNCNCNSQYQALLFNLKTYFSGRKKFPKYRWISTKRRFKYEDTIMHPYLNDDALIDKYIENNPDQKDYELIKKPKKENEN